MDIEAKIMQRIKQNPFITQQELATEIGLSRSSVAGYITALVKRGKIKGRAYILNDELSILCIGGANIDRKAHAKQKLDLYSSNPVTITESSGGVARNIAENLRKLDAKTALLTCVGDDKEGEKLLDASESLGIDVSQVWRFPEERTGTYTAILDTDGEMLISTADMALYDRMTSSLLADKWSFIAESRGVFMDTNMPAESIHYVISRGNAEGIPLYIDPVSDVKVKKLPDNLEGVDSIFPNRSEAGWLAGMQVDSIEDCEIACERIRQRGACKVVITLGSEGAYFAEEGHEGHLSPFRSHSEMVDVTGAGDAFTASVIDSLTAGQPLERAVRMGQGAAALTLQSDKTVSPLLSHEKLEEMIKEFS